MPVNNIYDLCYNILYDLMRIFDLNDENVVRLINFLNNEDTELDIIFEQIDYYEFPLEKTPYKNIMKLIIFSCSYKLLMYEKSKNIYYQEAVDSLEFLEQLDYEQILDIFDYYEENFDVIKSHLEYFSNYVKKNYIFINACLDEIIYSDNKDELFQINPFELLCFYNHKSVESMTKSEQYIQLFVDFNDIVDEEAVSLYPDNEDLCNEYFKKRFIQRINEYFKFDYAVIKQFYGYIFGNLYENLIILMNDNKKYRIKHIDIVSFFDNPNLSLDELLSIFLNDDDFFLDVVDYFLEYNYELTEGELEFKRNKFKQIMDSGTLKRFSSLYDEEEKEFKTRKIKYPGI